MNSEGPPAEILSAYHADDAERVRSILESHPELRARVNEKAGPFGSPAIVNVKSRAMLDVLLDAGADINAKSDWAPGGFGILHTVDPEVAAYAITRGAAIDAHAAARLGMVDELREMLARDSTIVHQRGGDGQLPLHFASTVEIAELLLNYGADIDARDLDHDSTAAQWMIGQRQEVARHLVSRRCQTDILMAAALGDSGLVQRHLDENPDTIRMTVGDDCYPMIDSGKNGGTIYQWTLGWYISPHRVARNFGHEEVRNLLLDRSPVAVRLVDACWSEDESTVDTLLAENPTIQEELTDSDRRNIAHAARNNKTEAVRLFLKSGFPLDSTSQHAATPLHWAGFHGNRAMAELILERDPPLEVKDRDFQGTPLSWTIYGSEHGWFRETGDYGGTVEKLLAAGASLPDSLGGSAVVREVLRRHGVQE